jgi:proline iminopeptidase
MYPEIEPFNTGRLQVSPLHSIYYEECGNPTSTTSVIFLHGGPGGGCSPSDRRYFNPDKYHIVLLDQRGCGRSSPSASDGGLEENTTWTLVQDIEGIGFLFTNFYTQRSTQASCDRWLGGIWRIVGIYAVSYLCD